MARQAEIFCDKRELHAMAAMPMARRVDGLIQTWTLKEAFLKAKGVGMSTQLDHFGFDFFAAARPHIHFRRPGPWLAFGLVFRLAKSDRRNLGVDCSATRWRSNSGPRSQVLRDRGYRHGVRGRVRAATGRLAGK